jgi:hypothetical protein
MRHSYEISMVSMEIAGPFAMFARPDTGSTCVPYPRVHNSIIGTVLCNTVRGTVGIGNRIWHLNGGNVGGSLRSLREHLTCIADGITASRPRLSQVARPKRSFHLTLIAAAARMPHGPGDSVHQQILAAYRTGPTCAQAEIQNWLASRKQERGRSPALWDSKLRPTHFNPHSTISRATRSMITHTYGGRQTLI